MRPGKEDDGSPRLTNDQRRRLVQLLQHSFAVDEKERDGKLADAQFPGTHIPKRQKLRGRVGYAVILGQKKRKCEKAQGRCRLPHPHRPGRVDEVDNLTLLVGLRVVQHQSAHDKMRLVFGRTVDDAEGPVGCL